MSKLVCFKPKDHSSFASVALLVLRLAVGVAFILHGWGKIQTPFGWMPGDNVPGFLQFLAAVSEFGGGIALILGLLTHLFSLGLFFTMLVATYFHAVVLGDPFVSKGGGAYELALIYACVSLAFLALGPGKFSLDQVIFGRCKK